MADVSLPGTELTEPSARSQHPNAPSGSVEAVIAEAIPGPVHGLLRALWEAGHSAYVVGGSLRDVVLGRVPKDWDLASNALPEEIVERFAGAVYENRFGTVAVRRDHQEFEITTLR